MKHPADQNALALNLPAQSGEITLQEVNLARLPSPFGYDERGQLAARMVAVTAQGVTLQVRHTGGLLTFSGERQPTEAEELAFDVDVLGWAPHAA